MPKILSSIEQYSQLIASIPSTYTTVTWSSLTLWSSGIKSAVLEGEVIFKDNLRLRLYEEIDFASAEILTYSYEVYQGDDKLYWYDPWPHPHDLKLASTHPHHKHVHPDIKHNRIPAPNMTFSAPNLPFLIAEIEQAIAELRSSLA